MAWRVGDEGRGVRTIIDMVNLTRLDCVIGAASGMRHGVVTAAHHVAHRRAFGRYLVDQPLMRNVLADLAVESEAATVLMMRLAGATDRSARGDAAETAFKRIALAVGKYWVCKRWPGHAAEALECLGGNGYVEESGMPRLFRESPLNSIWEGSGNVAALDVLRALAGQPEVLGRSSRRWTPPRAPTPGSTPRSARCGPPWPIRPIWRYAPVGWSNSWRWCCRARCWCATVTRRSPMPSARPGWAVTGDMPTARCRPASTSPRSSTGPPRRSADRSGAATVGGGTGAGDQQ